MRAIELDLDRLTTDIRRITAKHASRMRAAVRCSHASRAEACCWRARGGRGGSNVEDESEEKNLVHLLDMAVSDGVTTSMRLHRLCLFASFLALKCEKKVWVYTGVSKSQTNSFAALCERKGVYTRGPL